MGDAAEDDRGWKGLEEEEAEVKLLVSEMMWRTVLTETASLLIDLDEKLEARRQSSSSASTSVIG